MTPQEFVAKWRRVALTERSAAQQHFLDLCELLGHPKPAAADPDGTSYTFERGARKTDGGQGWADVWKKDFFAWEYKGKHKDLAAAYRQLLQYREDLDNPPLLVVCDLDRFEVHTNFTNTTKKVYAFGLDELDRPENLAVLRAVFGNPEALRPGQTTEDVTKEVAGRFAELADGMRNRRVPAERAAHFLMKLMFCMFAEDIGLLPDKLFSKVLALSKNDPKGLARRLHSLFQAMAGGGEFGADTILHFDGGLFADADVEELTAPEIEQVIRANDCDWSNVEPSIFGTLFERTLDPAKRSQIGAHYTSKDDILTLLEPVLMAPLRREWDAVRAQCDELWDRLRAAKGGRGAKGFRQSFEKTLRGFLDRLEEVRVLDPACGSGNFLYVAINLLLDLEKEVLQYAAMHDVTWFPGVRPSQLAGIEINPYAQQLAQVVIWIGYLQWMHHNGYKQPSDPVLEPIENICCADAILDLSDPAHPEEPEWPAAEFIVGNPPFLGGKRMRSELGDQYVESLFRVWRGRVRPEADLCCYWFERAQTQIKDGGAKRGGLLATQAIRGGANRAVLQRIQDSGRIFFAVSDRDWVLEGAHVHVSLIGFDAGEEATKVLDGRAVPAITTALTSGPSLDAAQGLGQNSSVSFMGITPAGKFDIDFDLAVSWLRLPNPNGKPNSDVLRPYANGKDLNQRPRFQWTIDFGTDCQLEVAAGYEAPFAHLVAKVKGERAKNNREAYRQKWWLYAEARPAMRAGFSRLDRYLATCMVAKHRAFVWLPTVCLPANVVIVFARSEDEFFGLLQSRVHMLWADHQGTQLREKESGARYTPSTCFETFPFPRPTDAQREAVAAAATELDALRNAWLNPPEWTREEVLEFPGSVDGPWKRFVHDTDGRGIGTVRYPRTVPKDAECAKLLQKRTLTNLYNERPTWLELAHQKLDKAVFAAYGWPRDMSNEELLGTLLDLNLKRAAEEGFAKGETA